MTRPAQVTRRGFVAAGVSAVGAAGVSAAEAAGNEKEEVAAAAPLAQDYSVVFQMPPLSGIMVDTPCLARTAEGRLLASHNLDVGWGGGAGHARFEREFPDGRHFHIHASDDRGETWRPLARLELADGMLITLDDAVYVLGTGRQGGARRDIFITRSTDGGESWEPLVQIHQGPAWNSATGVVRKNGNLYRAYDTATHQRSRKLFVVAGRMDRDLLDPAAWRISNELDFPGMPGAMKRPLYPEYRDHWLEPNVVDIHGRLTVIARCRVDNYGTCHLAGVCDLSDDGRNLRLDFAQFYPIPGAQHKFHILYDPPSRLFWMASTLVTDPQDRTGWGGKARARGFKGGVGNERRILMLSYSLDALNWFHAGCVAMWRDPLKGFMYAHLLVDGDDLLLGVRTSREGGNNHDAELITLHRVADFRRLALTLHPEV